MAPHSFCRCFLIVLVVYLSPLEKKKLLAKTSGGPFKRKRTTNQTNKEQTNRSSKAMMARKRSFSPTIDDIRQYNIKRYRLVNDLDSLNLSPHIQKEPPIIETHRDTSVEYIPDIEEFLLQNQDDADVIESSKQILDLRSVDPDKIVIPSSIIIGHNNKSSMRKLTSYDSKVSLERLKSRRDFVKRYGLCDGKLNYITTEDILYDFEILNYWGLIRYFDARLLVYRIWEIWYLNVFKLNEFSNIINQPVIDHVDQDDDDDVMVVDENTDSGYNDEAVYIDDGNYNYYKPKVRNDYGGYYYDVSDNSILNDETHNEETIKDDEDMMDLD